MSSWRIGKTSANARAVGSRRTWRNSLRAIEARRRNDSAVMGCLPGSNPRPIARGTPSLHGSPLSVAHAAAGQGEEDVVQAGVDRAHLRLVESEVGGGAVNIHEHADGMAEAVRLAHAGKPTEPTQQAPRVRA